MKVAIRVDSTGSVLLTGALLFCCILYCWRVAQVARADVLSNSTDRTSVETGRLLDPLNAEIHYRMGQQSLYGSDIRSADAVGALRRATDLQPRVPRYWSALGRMCLAAGEERCAQSSFETAAAIAPLAPQRHRELATFYLLAGDSSKAIRELRLLLELSPTEADEIVGQFIRVETPEAVWRGALEPHRDVRVRLALVNALAAAERFEEAERWWRVAATRDVTLRDVIRYLRALEDHGRYRYLAAIWSDLQNSGVLQGADAGQVVYNGGFERPPQGIGFDWHIVSQQFAVIGVEDGGRSGKASLNLRFTVPNNQEYLLAYQVVPVKPNSSYSVAGWIRSEGMTSDSGVRIRVTALDCAADCVLAQSADVKGTSEWRQVDADFTTGREAEFVKVCIVRGKSRTFPADVTGVGWVDDVSMQPDERRGVQ